MPTAKLSTVGSSNAMTSAEGSDNIETMVTEATGRSPILVAENPVQWMQILHSLDQPDLQSWPMVTTPLKINMLKCEKCSGEFFSTINYRRHARMHRRSLNSDKESRNYRELLGAFWDNLSVEEAKEVASLADVSLKGISGSFLVNSLSDTLHKSGAWIWNFPSVYMKAGSILLDIIEAKPSSFPVSSLELFSVLNEASEGTFLFCGTAESVQKYVFDDEVDRVGLELRNLVSSICFLFEQKLLKSWVVAKDAEALRCQKLLVEEEEAARRRQTELLKKKRQKKLRQKEQKARDQLSVGKLDLGGTDDSSDTPQLSEITSPSTTLDVAEDFSSLEMVCIEKIEEEIKGSDFCIAQNAETEQNHGTLDVAEDFSSLGIVCIEKNEEETKGSDLGIAQNAETEQNHDTCGERRTADETTDKGLGNSYQNETTEIENTFELMIGSITVPIKMFSIQPQGTNLSKPLDYTVSTPEEVPKQNYFSEMPRETDPPLRSITEVPTDDWVPVISKHKKGSKGRKDHEEYSEENTNATSDSPELPDCNKHNKGLCFFNGVAKTFLSKRWNEAVSADHVKLLICPDPKPPGSPSPQVNIPKSASPSPVKSSG